ncbi:MAG: hypothetical protein ACM3SY_10060 [Candidatus Omnitrophota bacterium]
MIHMLCRNRVKDFEHWLGIFNSQDAAARAVGLKSIDMWQDIDDPNNVFFLFEVEHLESAKNFINRPESAEVGRIAGVLDGEYHFITPTHN